MTVKMTISVTGTQVGEIDEIPYQSGMNVQLAMEEAYNLHTDKAYTFSLQYFGSALGYEVTALDSIANQVGSDSDTYVFWALYINGAFQPVGIDSARLHDGDIIEWNYQAFDPEQHGGTRHEQIRDILRTKPR